jgi:hypothetical protein
MISALGMYWISGQSKTGYRISGEGRIPDIRPDFQRNIQMSRKIWNKQRNQMHQGFCFLVLKHKWHFLHQRSNGFKMPFLKMLQIDVVISPFGGISDRLAGFFSIRYPAGCPASNIRYPVGYRISKKAGYPMHSYRQ